VNSNPCFDLDDFKLTKAWRRKSLALEFLMALFWSVRQALQVFER
jgi:hypothetical protein